VARIKLVSASLVVLFRSLVYFVIFYVNTALFLVFGSWLLLAPRRWAMQGLRQHGLASLWLLKTICGTHLEVRGREKLPAGACLVASKHQSAWDTFALIPIFRDPAMVMKADLGWIPLYGWFSHKFQHIFVKRDKGPSALKALVRDARDRAAQGREIVIFPEGTRRSPGAPPDYKPGFLALYEGLGLPCVPLALNSGLFWPRRSLMRYPGTIVVEVLEPVPAGLPRQQARTLIQEKIETACAQLIAEARAKPNPPPLPSSARRTAEVEA
jgi:1-acyl-sn-glycerol-3-phosphate acyltransferase